MKIAFVLFFLDSIAFVMQFFASAKSEFDFDESVLKVHFERNERVTLLLDFSAEFVDFGAVEEQLSRATGVNVVVTAHLIRRNMCAEHKHFAVFDYDETISEVDCSETYGLHFTPDERDARLVGVLDEIVVISLFVVCVFFLLFALKEFLLYFELQLLFLK